VDHASPHRFAVLRSGKWRAIRLSLKITIILVSRLSISVSVATQCDYKAQVSDRPHGVRARLQSVVLLSARLQKQFLHSRDIQTMFLGFNDKTNTATDVDLIDYH
jgi:hypothetical protein